MSDLTAVIRHFPAHELVVRRLYANAPDFRVLCEDFGAALRALEHWHCDKVRAEEYRRLVAEIGEEIREVLKNSLRWRHD